VSKKKKKEKARSPCVDICKIGKSTGLCKGCLRTKAEIKDWKSFSKLERRAVLQAIEERKLAA
jgi:predicted Fe-S protein YdhL (DUF1289 family)